MSDYQIKYSHGGEPPDAPLEETPAAVARLDAVVLAARLVAAHLAQHVHLFVHRGGIAPETSNVLTTQLLIFPT